MNTRRIIENGLYGLFTVAVLIDKYAPHVAVIAIVVGGIYWWPESKIFFMMMAGMVGLVIALVVVLVIIGTAARSVGYEPDLDFGFGTSEENVENE